MVPVGELAEAQVLHLLPRAALEALAEDAVRHAYRAGDVLFREGEPGDLIHILRRGEVVVVRDPHGVTLARCGPGDVFGELAVLTGAPRSATLIATTAAETVSVSREALEAVLDAHPGAMRTLLAGLASSLTRAKEELAGHNRVLEQRVRDRTQEVRETHLEVLRRLGAAVESRDDETGEHIVRMSRMAAALAGYAGLGAATSEMLLRAAPLHDIGKIGLPDHILHKPGALDPGERQEMERHTVLGARLLSGSRSPVVRMAESIARSHHERWDGTGYPDGLAGDDIPLAARVCAIADVFDALISERPYKRAWGPAAAVAAIEDGSGAAFDPDLVGVFAQHSEEILAAARIVVPDFPPANLGVAAGTGTDDPAAACAPPA